MVEFLTTIMNKCTWHHRKEEGGNEKIHHVPHKKLPFLFSPLGLGLHILTQIAILAAVASLWALSNTHNGVVAVPSTPSSMFGGGLSDALLWSFSFLWTTVPSILVSLYAIMFSSLVDGLKSAQVTMELCETSRLDNACLVCHREHHWGCRWNPLPLFFKYHHRYKQRRAVRSTPERTILLDYSSLNYSIPVFNAWEAATRNRHYIVAACMLVKLAVSPISTGFAANILSVANVPSETTVPLTWGKDFDPWALTEVSLRPAFDIVSASVVNGAQTIPWTTSKNSFRPLSFLSLDTYDGNWNITAPAVAYSSILECDVMDINEVAKQGGLFLDAPIGSANGAQLHMTFQHRGCVINDRYVTLITVGDLHIQSWAKIDCSYASGVERFGFFAGTVDSSAKYGLANFTLVSCIPTFWNSSGSVTVTASEQKSQVVSSSIASPKAFENPGDFSGYLKILTQYASIDINEDIKVDQIGRLSYNLASTLDSVPLKDAFQTIYTALFAAAASLGGYTVDNSTSSGTTVDGTLSRPTNRLFVVWRPAVIVMASIGAALICTIWAAFYMHIHKETLLRGHEPVVLANAMMLDGGSGGDEVANYINILKADAAKSIKAEERMELEKKKRLEERRKLGWKTRYCGLQTEDDGGPKDTSNVEPEDEYIDPEEVEQLLKERNIIEYARKKEDLGGDNWECWLDEKDKIRLSRTGGMLGYREESTTSSA